MQTDPKKRCAWLPCDKMDYVHYHDNEWGKPVRCDHLLFEMLCLETAQAGLSWYTILKKRQGYKEAFCNFDVQKCAMLGDEQLEHILQNGQIVRNRLKVFSVRKNARVFLSLQKEFGSFSAYLWSFVQDKTLVYRPQTMAEIHVTTPESDALSKDLKKRGMTFVGSTTMQAYMQAVGLIDEHTADCFLAHSPYHSPDKALQEMTPSAQQRTEPC